MTLKETIRTAIWKALDSHNGNVTRAARDLGISARTLQRKLAGDRELRHHVLLTREKNVRENAG